MTLDRRAERRLARERRTLELMIRLYCDGHHAAAATERQQGLCAPCGELWAYAQQRLDRCVFAQEKPTCASCPIHCYRADMRSRVRDVMRWAGPRMLLPHPVLTILHLRDERRPLSEKASAIRARRQAQIPAV